MKGSGRDSTRLGRRSRGASLPAEHSWLCLGAGGNPSVSGAHLVHSSTAKAFLQDTFQHSVAELGAQGAGEGQGGSPRPSPGPSSVPRSSSASWITTSVKNLKTSSSSQLGAAAPEPGAAVPKGMAAGGPGKRELEGLDAQRSASSFPSLRAHEFIPCCAPRLCPAVGAAIPWPWDAGLDVPRSSQPPQRSGKRLGSSL